MLYQVMWFLLSGCLGLVVLMFATSLYLVDIAGSILYLVLIAVISYVIGVFINLDINQKLG
jgi:hypothetical protein